MNSNALRELLTNAVTELSVEPVSDSTVRIIVPTFRHVHDSVAFALTEHDAGWTLSDGGQLHYLLDDDFDRVVGAMECAGALFTAADTTVEFDIEHESSLADSVLAFAHYLSAAPVVWHALDCARTGSDRRLSSVDLMAREAKSNMVSNIGPRVRSLVHLHHTVTDREESAPAPLAVAARGTKIRPTLVASFIDTTAPKPSFTTAKRNTTFLLEVIRDWNTTRKYVVVRGNNDAVDHFAQFYDQTGVVTVSTEDPGPLYDDTSEAMEALVPTG